MRQQLDYPAISDWELDEHRDRGRNAMYGGNPYEDDVEPSAVFAVVARSDGQEGQASG